MKKNVAVIGSSGAIGNAVSKILLDDASIESVYNFSRSTSDNSSEKSKNIYIDIEGTPQNKSKITFISATLFQSYSWGKNEENLEKLAKSIDNSLII